MFLRNFTLTLVGCSLFFASCKDKKKDDPEPTKKETTVTEDKQNITQSFKEINTCVDEIKSGQLVALIRSIFQINQGESVEPEWLEVVFETLPNAFDFDIIEQTERLDIGTHSAKYSYDKTTQDWIKSPNSTGEIIIEFPSTNGGDNDLKLTVTGYKDQTKNIDGNQIGLPTEFFLNFSQNSTTLVEIKLNSVQYEQLPTIAIPIYIDVDITLAPLDIKIIGRRVNNTKFDLKVEMTNGGSCNTTLYSEMQLKNDDYENLVEDDIDYIKGSISHNALKVSTNIDFDVLYAIEEPTTGQVNSLIDVDVFYDDVKIGDLEAEDINNGEVFYIVYKDGSRDDVNEAYLVPFLEDLEITLFDLIGNWD